jgi:hypothetical protein
MPGLQDGEVVQVQESGARPFAVGVLTWPNCQGRMNRSRIVLTSEPRFSYLRSGYFRRVSRVENQ